MTKISVMILMIVIITTTTISSEREMKKTKEADDVGTLLAEIFSQIRRIANVEFYLLFARLQDAVSCSKYQPSTI